MPTPKPHAFLAYLYCVDVDAPFKYPQWADTLGFSRLHDDAPLPGFTKMDVQEMFDYLKQFKENISYLQTLQMAQEKKAQETKRKKTQIDVGSTCLDYAAKGPPHPGRELWKQLCRRCWAKMGAESIIRQIFLESDLDPGNDLKFDSDGLPIIPKSTYACTMRAHAVVTLVFGEGVGINTDNEGTVRSTYRTAFVRVLSNSYYMMARTVQRMCKSQNELRASIDRTIQRESSLLRLYILLILCSDEGGRSQRGEIKIVQGRDAQETVRRHIDILSEYAKIQSKPVHQRRARGA